VNELNLFCADLLAAISEHPLEINYIGYKTVKTWTVECMQQQLKIDFPKLRHPKIVIV
jgi:hypothetical protein